MKHILLLLLSGLLGMLFVACQKNIDDEIPDHEPVIVVNSTFNPDSLWKAHISHSLGILDTGDISILENATVGIYQNGTQVDDLVYAGNGNYRGTTKPQIGVEYELRASAPDYAPVSASDVIPQRVTFSVDAIRDSAFFSSEGTRFGLGGEIPMAEADITIPDPPGNNYYLLQLMQYDVAISAFDTVEFYENILFDVENDALGAYREDGYAFSDAGFDGQAKTLKIIFPSGWLNGTQDLILFLSTTSEDFYRYRQTWYGATLLDGDLFFVPDFQHHNIEGGLGIFAGFSWQADTLRK